MGAQRIKGTNVLFKLGAEDYGGDCAKVVLDNEDADGDVTTFEDAAAGGSAQWFFDVDSVQSTEQPTSLWRYLWANAGTEGIAYTYAPHGNAVPTESKPHFTGELTLPKKPTIGGEAGRNKTYTFTVRLDVTGEPLLVDGS